MLNETAPVAASMAIFWRLSPLADWIAKARGSGAKRTRNAAALDHLGAGGAEARGGRPPGSLDDRTIVRQRGEATVVDWQGRKTEGMRTDRRDLHFDILPCDSQRRVGGTGEAGNQQGGSRRFEHLPAIVVGHGL